MCNCIKQMDELLKPHGVELDLMLSLVGKPTTTIISTFNIKDSRKLSKLRLQATYCPFCGEKYDNEKESQS